MSWVTCLGFWQVLKQAESRAGSDIIKSSGSAVVSLQNTLSPLG